MKATCWVIVLMLLAVAASRAPCHAALADAGYVKTVSGEVSLRTVDRNGNDREYKLDPMRHVGCAVYANESIRCGKNGSCELYLFGVKGGEPARTIKILPDSAKEFIGGVERRVLELNGYLFIVGGLSGAGGGGRSDFPAPPDRRKKYRVR